ncbi:TolC family protein [Tepidibacter hydrothermalis]|uniref:TolC family protein n=1 Tax=Tepidibacter hydrothermalis TaxID=3036126 RepID=A0ABY8EFU3_9FIRM|nr:TolC family protein [Tepidibacter hydrothermalis]WFD09613.1 TolC family protein [Tepidibacter hydrothermalis]
MKKIITGILLVIFTFISSINAYADEKSVEDKINISIEEAIEEAIKNSTELKSSDLDIEIKEIELDEAKHTEKKYDNSDISLGTVEGFQLDANMMSKKAEYALEEEKIKKDYKKEDIKHNVTQAYYGSLNARDYMNVAKDNLENVQRNRDIVNKKYELGVASKSDLIMADISLNEAKASFEKSKTDLEKAYRSLNMILNYPLDTKIELTSSFKQEVFDENLDEDLEKAYESRFDIIQMNHNYELVKLDFETNSIMYPSNTYKYKTKERNLAKIESGLADVKNMVEFDIRGKYDDVINAQNQIELAKANVEKTKEVLRLKEFAYNVELGTLLEVDNALNQLYNSKIALSNAISSYNLAVIDYDKAVSIGTVK